MCLYFSGLLQLSDQIFVHGLRGRLEIHDSESWLVSAQVSGDQRLRSVRNVDFSDLVDVSV